MYRWLPIDIVYSVFDVFNLESGYNVVEYGYSVYWA